MIIVKSCIRQGKKTERKRILGLIDDLIKRWEGFEVGKYKINELKELKQKIEEHSEKISAESRTVL